MQVYAGSTTIQHEGNTVISSLISLDHCQNLSLVYPWLFDFIFQETLVGIYLFPSFSMFRSLLVSLVDNYIIGLCFSV